MDKSQEAHCPTSMLQVGVAQTQNSTDVAANFSSICSFLDRFEKKKADLILFPECSLSGFSAKISECSLQKLAPFLDSIERWSKRSGIHVVLPTAIAEGTRVYNSGFWFCGSNGVQRFQKLGLTESEKKFFSVSEWSEHRRKVFEVKGFRCALLICMEAQQPAYTYFDRESADLILWPGYWGWTLEDDWSASSQNGKPNLVYQNMTVWELPLIQSNFAYNDLGEDSKSGPEGLSVVVDSKNNLRHRSTHRAEAGFVVSLSQNGLHDCVPL